VLTTPACASVNSRHKPDLGLESQFLPTHMHSTPPLGGSRRNFAVPFGKEKLEWCGADGEKIVTICLFVLTEFTNVTDTHVTQTPHDDIGRACIASRGKNEGLVTQSSEYL